jgi:hypothetical protein
MRTPSQARGSIISAAMAESLYAKIPPALWRRGNQAKWLARKGEQLLADKVAQCRPGNRCLSPACLHCRAIEQVVTAKVIKKRARAQEDSEVGFASIVPLGTNVQLGNLVAFDVDNFSRRIRDGLAKTDAWWAAGAIDLSVNVHAQDAFEPFWQPHAALMVASEGLDDLKHQLKAAFPSDALTPRPVLVKPWDGRSAVFPYLLKTSFGRRITVDNQLRHNKTKREWRSCRGTTYDRLRAEEELEVAIFLDRMGLGGRLLLRNVRLRGSEGRVWLE